MLAGFAVSTDALLTIVLVLAIIVLIFWLFGRSRWGR